MQVFYPGLKWNLEMLDFVEGGLENQRTLRKTLKAKREPTTHIWHWAGIKLGPHGWEANFLTTLASLLPTPGVFPWFIDLMTVFQDKQFYCSVLTN